MVDFLDRYVLPAAFDLLPAEMASVHAAAMLIAIALQESKCAARAQRNGPARGFWQFETTGLQGVLRHPATGQLARQALVGLCYSASLTPSELRLIVEDNDPLACVFARLLLWTVPQALPERQDADGGWKQYLQAWQPGKPRPKDWPGNFERGWNVATANGGNL